VHSIPHLILLTLVLLYFCLPSLIDIVVSLRNKLTD